MDEYLSPVHLAENGTGRHTITDAFVINRTDIIRSLTEIRS